MISYIVILHCYPSEDTLEANVAVVQDFKFPTFSHSVFVSENVWPTFLAVRQ